MAIVKNNFRVSRLKGEFSPRSKESMSTDEDELQRHSSASEYDEEDEADDDNDEEDEDADSGMDSDDVDLSELGEVGEELCQVGNQICSVPFELYDLQGLSDILSVDVWNDCLTEEERFGLAKYLPDMDQESFLRTMKELFSGGNFHFGSPLVKLFDMLKGGSCEPRVMLYQHGWNFFQKFRHYHHLRKYQNSMVGKFVQINNAWLSCKGYSIEERLRVLNLTRSQRNLSYDKAGDMGLESDSSGREEFGDGLWTRKLKETHGSKMGHQPLYMGSPTVDVMARYGKSNPKGILKLAGSKVSAEEGLMGSYPPSPYDSLQALSRKESMAGYYSGNVRQGKAMAKGGLTRNRDMNADEPLIGVPLPLHAQRKNWNADQIAEMTMRLDRGSPDFNLRDAGKKSKYLDRNPPNSVEDRPYNGKGRPQPPMSKFIPVDRSMDSHNYHHMVAKEEVLSEDWDIRGDKWKVRPEFQNHKNSMGFDTKARRYGSPQSQLNDMYSPSGHKALKSQKKIKRESVQNGFDLEEFSQSDETESDSSEQVHEEGTNHSRSKLGYPSSILEGHGKNNKLNRKEKMYDSGERLHLRDVEMYTLKGKQKGKIQDPRYLHSYTEERGLPMAGDDGKKAYKSHKADHMQSEQYRPYPSGKKKKSFGGKEYHGYSRDYMDGDSSPIYLDDTLKADRVGKKGLLSATGRFERANMPLLECSSSSKKRKGKSDVTYMTGLGESDMYYSQQQQVDEPSFPKKRGKRDPEMDSDSLAMLSSEQGLIDVEPETKPGKKPFILITPSTHTGFSFSIIHLLSAVRVAMVTPLAEDVLAIVKHNENAEQNGKHETLNGGPSVSDQTRSNNLPALTVLDIVNRVKTNPGDPAILETQEPLQDLVRGVLKIFSSKTAPLGAKGWKALVSYEKSTKSWSWIGPVSTISSESDMVEEVTSCESWNLPHKMLVKLVDCFANWLKNGQETLQQIGSLPAPPLTLMQTFRDEKERFRDLRAQKSLTTISPSSEEVRAYFRREEILRYSVPDRAFSYTAADGRKSIVAPLRRGGGKPTSKARDHPILKPDRPPHVTILCLVRDAAARLPGSIGTRADVCMLIRDSQYIVEDVTDAQVNQVVSGALDRLHYERDPCVQFDSERKLWVYLHRDREEEDFEDDGTSSTKKWKRPRKEASEQTDNAMVSSVAYHGNNTSEQIVTYEIETIPVHAGERMDLVYQGNNGSFVGSEQGRLYQGGRGMDWNSVPDSNMVCQENSTNDDYDEPFRRDGRFSASLNNGVT